MSKGARGGVTTADVTVLTDDARVAEIARMLGGDPESDVSRAHARELLESAGRRSRVAERTARRMRFVERRRSGEDSSRESSRHVEPAVGDCSAGNCIPACAQRDTDAGARSRLTGTNTLAIRFDPGTSSRVGPPLAAIVSR